MQNPPSHDRRAAVQNIEKPVSILAPTAPATQAPARTQQIKPQHLQKWLVNIVSPAGPAATVPTLREYQLRVIKQTYKSYRFYLEAVRERLNKPSGWVTQQMAREFGGES